MTPVVIPDWMRKHLDEWGYRVLHDDERDEVLASMETWLSDPDNLAEVETQNLSWPQVRRRAEDV
jgi:hypothetical protein